MRNSKKVHREREKGDVSLPLGCGEGVSLAGDLHVEEDDVFVILCALHSQGAVQVALLQFYVLGSRDLHVLLFTRLHHNDTYCLCNWERTDDQ